MTPLFRLFTWRHQRRHLLRAFLGLASIALGVALYVSIEVAQASTVHAFEQSARRMAGKAELRVSRGRQAGIEISVLQQIEEIEGVAAAPALQKSATFPDLASGPVLVLGVDFRREPKFRDFSFGKASVNPFLMNERGLLVTRAFASRHGLAIGRSLRIHTPAGVRPVHVAGLIDDTGPASVFDGNVAVMEIGGAQKLFATGGRVDRIDVFPASAADSIRGKLGPGCVVEPVRATSSVMEEVLARVRSLVAISVVAMMAGLFIIYLSVSIGVTERAKEVGTLRALGASRSQTLALFLGEAAVLGLAGSCLGLFLGYGLAKVLIAFTARTVNFMSQQLHVEETVFPAWVAAAALAAGTLVSLLAALVPALRATAISPLEVLRPAAYGGRRRASFRRGFVLGAVLFAGSAIGVAYFYFRVPVWAGLLMGPAALLATALMLPQVALWLSRLMRAPLRAAFRIEGALASDNVMKYPERTALTVVALGAALGIMITSASVFASFERSGMRWMEQAFPWDLSVQASDLSLGYASDVRLPREVCDRVKQVDGVASAFALQSVLQEYGRQDVMLLAMDMRSYMEMMRAAGLEREDFSLDAPSVREVIRGEAVGVSTNLLKLRGLEPGDRIELRTPAGPRSFKVAYHQDDFTWPQGVIVIDLALYRELWNDSTVRYIDLRVEPGRDLEKVKAALGKALEGEFGAIVYSKAQIVGIAREVLGESFRLTQVQVLVAMIIGFMGIVNTLLISVLRRTREIGPPWRRSATSDARRVGRAGSSRRGSSG